MYVLKKMTNAMKQKMPIIVKYLPIKQIHHQKVLSLLQFQGYLLQVPEKVPAQKPVLL